MIDPGSFILPWSVIVVGESCFLVDLYTRAPDLSPFSAHSYRKGLGTKLAHSKLTIGLHGPILERVLLLAVSY